LLATLEYIKTMHGRMNVEKKMSVLQLKPFISFEV